MSNLLTQLPQWDHLLVLLRPPNDGLNMVVNQRQCQPRQSQLHALVVNSSVPIMDTFVMSMDVDIHVKGPYPFWK